MAVSLQNRDGAFYEGLEKAHLTAFWRAIAPLQKETPARAGRAFLWHWDDVRPLLGQAGEVVAPGPDAERRVLVFAHPDMPGGTTTATLIGSLQMVLPGEAAPSHRHSMAAIRFILSGRGAFTDVDGERIPVEPYDLVLTPSWTWHGHGNETAEPVVWLDGLDSPLVRALVSDFFEPDRADANRIVKAPDHTRRQVGTGLLRPETPPPAVRALPMIYRWGEVEAELRRQSAAEGDPFDGVLVHYVNPLGGGPTLPTMDCRVQLLRAGETTRAHRHTGSTVYHVVRGAGFTEVGGERFAWHAGDTLSLPPWAWHAHGSEAGGESVLFSYTDAPVLAALGLYREEAR